MLKEADHKLDTQSSTPPGRMLKLVPRGDISALAESFPSLRGRPGVSPFNFDLLHDQLSQGWITGGSRFAIQFILSVWNSDENPFNVVQALNVWDEAHTHAFLAWAMEPWTC